jgi:heme A synthase
VIPARPSAGFRRLAVATAVITYLLIIWGGIVRVTGSGNGCGTTDQWPLCHGSLLPAWQINTLIEFTHRWIASVCTILVVALTLAAWIWHRHQRKIVVGTGVAAGLFVVQIVLGALAVEFNLPGGVVMIHLANALLLFAVLIYVAVVACTVGTPDRSPSPSAALAPSVTRPVVIAVVATYLLALSGAFVVERGAGSGCSSWPLCGSGFSLPAGQPATINMAHRVVALVVVILLGGLMAMIGRRRKSDRGVRIGIVAVNALLVLQVAAGALVVLLALPAWARGLHIALASLLWGTVVFVAVLSRRPEAAREPVPPMQRAETLRPAEAARL